MLTQKALEIMEQRRLEGETLAQYGVSSFLKDGFEWLKIPYLVDGQAVNHKYRSIEGEKKFHQDENAHKCIWNFDVLKDVSLKTEPLIITEGELDALSAIQCGYLRTISVPDGAPAHPNAGDQKYSYLPEILPLIQDEREIIIASDGDEKGANLLHDLSHRLGRQRCKWLQYPKDCKDLNEALNKYGPEAVKQTIKRAQWLRIEGVYDPASLPPAPTSRSYSTGFPIMNNHYNIRLGDFTVVTGIPSHGKSTWVNDLCCRMAKNHGFKTAFASFEQHPAMDHLRNLRRWYIGKHQSAWDHTDIETADTWINNHFCFLMPAEDDDVNLEWVLERASAAVIQKGAKILVIDPWNEMDHDYPRDMTLTQYTGFAIKQFRKFARKHNIHLILVAHPAKMKKNSDGTFDIPSLYEISDSAHWYNKADVGVVIHRKSNTESLIRIAKSRYHDIIGKPGDISAYYNPILNKYEITEGVKHG